MWVSFFCVFFLNPVSCDHRSRGKFLLLKTIATCEADLSACAAPAGRSRGLVSELSVRAGVGGGVWSLGALLKCYLTSGQS